MVLPHGLVSATLTPTDMSEACYRNQNRSDCPHSAPE